jgi:hypothetical protein
LIVAPEYFNTSIQEDLKNFFREGFLNNGVLPNLTVPETQKVYGCTDYPLNFDYCYFFPFNNEDCKIFLQIKASKFQDWQTRTFWTFAGAVITAKPKQDELKTFLIDSLTTPIIFDQTNEFYDFKRTAPPEPYKSKTFNINQREKQYSEEELTELKEEAERHQMVFDKKIIKFERTQDNITRLISLLSNPFLPNFYFAYGPFESKFNEIQQPPLNKRDTNGYEINRATNAYRSGYPNNMQTITNENIEQDLSSSKKRTTTPFITIPLGIIDLIIKKSKRSGH